MNITRDDEHRYRIDGCEWPSVTKVLTVINKPGLNQYREKVGTDYANRVRDAAGKRGTLVHALASLHATQTPALPLDRALMRQVRAQVDAFEAWYRENVTELLGTELFVAHPAWKYAGQLDFLVRLKRSRIPVLVDIKTGNAVGKEARAQTAAYREAAVAMGLTDRRCRRGVLWLPGGEQRGRCEFKEHDNHATDFAAYLNALALFRWLAN